MSAQTSGPPVKEVLIALAVGAYAFSTPWSCDGDDYVLVYLWWAAVLLFPVAFVWAGSSVGVACGFSRFTSAIATAAIYLLAGVVIAGVAAIVYDLSDASRWLVLSPAFWIVVLSGLAGTLPDCGN